MQLGFVPDWTDSGVEDRGAIALELMDDIDVIRELDTMVVEFLEWNYFPLRVFGNGYDLVLRERIFENSALRTSA